MRDCCIRATLPARLTRCCGYRSGVWFRPLASGSRSTWLRGADGERLVASMASYGVEEKARAAPCPPGVGAARHLSEPAGGRRGVEDGIDGDSWALCFVLKQTDWRDACNRSSWSVGQQCAFDRLKTLMKRERRGECRRIATRPLLVADRGCHLRRPLNGEVGVQYRLVIQQTLMKVMVVSFGSPGLT